MVETATGSGGFSGTRLVRWGSVFDDLGLAMLIMQLLFRQLIPAVVSSAV